MRRCRASARDLSALAKRFDELHERYEEHIALTSIAWRASRRRSRNADAPGDPNVAHTKDITVRFDTKRCIHSRHCVLEAPNVFRANTQGAGFTRKRRRSNTSCASRTTARPAPSPTTATTAAPNERAPDVNVVRIRENGPYAVNAAVAMGERTLTRATLCRCGQSKNKPFCDNSHIAAKFAATGEPETIASDPLEFRAGALTIDPLPDGPLQLMGNVEICAGTGRTVTRAQNARLCRCGGSRRSPSATARASWIYLQRQPSKCI